MSDFDPADVSISKDRYRDLVDVGYKHLRRFLLVESERLQKENGLTEREAHRVAVSWVVGIGMATYKTGRYLNLFEEAKQERGN